MQNFTMRVETDKMFLSGESRIFKTERFMKETRKMAGVDDFVTKLAEGMFVSLARFDSSQEGYLLVTEDGEHSFFVRFGEKITGDLPLLPKDIVFFRYIDREKSARSNDQRFLDFLMTHKVFSVRVSAIRCDETDFRKIYRIANADNVNFPLLSDEQKKIVTTEDKNVLVQGVAGSGKTNICIDKIIYSVSRSYAGRILYSTYSRGLLIETKTRVQLFAKSLTLFLEKYRDNKIVFCDQNKKGAVENRLGVLFSVDEPKQIVEKIEEILLLLSENVDYFLLEDLYRKFGGTGKIADEDTFIRQYLGNIKNYRLSGKLERIKDISYEVIYKEIFGMIFGSFTPEKPAPFLSQEEYIEARKGDFGKAACEVIYSIAMDYDKYMEKNGLVDNNTISRFLMKKTDDFLYSLAILDEVQDFTQVNLSFLKQASFRMFCVGDALQMINPSFFSFPYLKRLLFKEDEATVAELKHNFRNTEKIERIIEDLGKLNVAQFGTHSFVLKGQSVESDVQTATVYVTEGRFAEEIAQEKFDNFTVVCSGKKQKEELRKILKKQEILTVSEIKGLERDAVLLYDVLSDNGEKWRELFGRVINRKTADENSVYRYYFNLFYVGVSRAKQYLYVYEKKEMSAFSEFFKQNFQKMSSKEAIRSLGDVVKKIEVDQEEILERIRQFINLGQYDNGYFLTDKIEDDAVRREYKNRIDVHKEFIREGRYRDGGIRYWELGMTEDAKKMFTLSGDEKLVELVDALTQGKESHLDPDIVLFYPELEENEGARTLILRVLETDLARTVEKQKSLNRRLRGKKE